MKVLVFHERVSRAADEGFERCVDSIHRHSPHCEILRIGNNRQWLSQYVQEFDKVYRHISVLPESFERRGIVRWIYFYGLCQEMGIKEFFTLDSDVLIFCDLEEENKRWGETDISIMDPNSHSLLTLGVSFFRKIDVLASFVDWLVWVYSHPESVDWKSMLASTNNMTDMWIWTYYLKFYNGGTKYSWNDLCTPRDGRVWDANMQLLTGGWESDGESKKINFKGGKPHGVLNGNPVILNCLHCWGIWKNRMSELWKKSLCIS